MDHLRALRILGLPPGATADDIHGAWRDLAKVWHPDRFPHDERLRRKAGDNLSRINQAHDALENYDPSQSPKISSRMRLSVAMVLGLGEIGDPPPSPAAPAPPAPRLVPRGPIGLRHSLRLLGLGAGREPGEAGTRRSPRYGAALLLVILLILLATVLISLP
jgi:hypothetical protein